MKQNLPVSRRRAAPRRLRPPWGAATTCSAKRGATLASQREYPIGEHEVLLSTTDLKGRITYANEAFIQVSGFTRENIYVYGKAHNVVRHPDMPPEAFADGLAPGNFLQTAPIF